MKLSTKIFIVSILSLLVILCFLAVKLKNSNEQLSVLNNNKVYYTQELQSYKLKNDQNVSRSAQLINTISELKYSKDSMDLILMKTIELMKIKDNKIVSLIHYNSSTTNTNHGVFTDSIIPKPNDSIDERKTIIKTSYLKSEWVDNIVIYNTQNDSIIVTTFSRDELIIVGHKKRETINPPKKFFLWRWFQKKQDIIYFDITNRNKNCKIDYIKSVKIVK